MPLLVFLVGLFFASEPHTLHVTVSSSSPEGGPIRLAVYASEADFVNKRALASAVSLRADAAAGMQLALPFPGTYVLAAFHDLNNNGELDRNFFGIPTEPYGFSKAPESKWAEPVFAEVATTFDGKLAEARLELKWWKEY